MSSQPSVSYERGVHSGVGDMQCESDPIMTDYQS